MEKYLYFRTVADVDGDDGDVSSGAISDCSSGCWPVSAFRGMKVTSASAITMYFTGTQNSLADGAASQAENTSDNVIINVTAGRMREVMTSLIDKINEPVSRDNGFVVVADDVTTNLANETVSAEYVSSHITSCGAIEVQAAQA